MKKIGMLVAMMLAVSGGAMAVEKKDVVNQPVVSAAKQGEVAQVGKKEVKHKNKKVVNKSKAVKETPKVSGGEKEVKVAPVEK